MKKKNAMLESSDKKVHFQAQKNITYMSSMQGSSITYLGLNNGFVSYSHLLLIHNIASKTHEMRWGKMQARSPWSLADNKGEKERAKMPLGYLQFFGQVFVHGVQRKGDDRGVLSFAGYTSACMHTKYTATM